MPNAKPRKSPHSKLSKKIKTFKLKKKCQP
jgi:hypothetical protein